MPSQLPRSVPGSARSPYTVSKSGPSAVVAGASGSVRCVISRRLTPGVARAAAATRLPTKPVAPVMRMRVVMSGGSGRR